MVFKTVLMVVCILPITDPTVGFSVLTCVFIVAKAGDSTVVN